MFRNPITLILGLLCLLFLARDAHAYYPQDINGDMAVCRGKSQDAHIGKTSHTPLFPLSLNPFSPAIQQFCNLFNIYVPSSYAIGGYKYKSKKVSIKNKCGKKMNSRPQWVPQEWCYRQMYWTCNSGADKSGNKRRRFGPGNCQEFRVYSKF